MGELGDRGHLRRMHELLYEADKHRNRFKFSEIASIGLECSNWISALRSKDFYYGSFLMEAGCFRINSSVSNKIDYMMAKKL